MMMRLISEVFWTISDYASGQVLLRAPNCPEARRDVSLFKYIFARKGDYYNFGGWWLSYLLFLERLTYQIRRYLFSIPFWRAPKRPQMPFVLRMNKLIGHGIHKIEWIQILNIRKEIIFICLSKIFVQNFEYII